MKKPLQKPPRCPDCGSTELRETTRKHPIHGDISAIVCGVCDWTSDRRIGRPPADRSKNFTLRRLLEQPGTDEADDQNTSDEA